MLCTKSWVYVRGYSDIFRYIGWVDLFGVQNFEYCFGFSENIILLLLFLFMGVWRLVVQSHFFLTWEAGVVMDAYDSACPMAE